MTARVFHADLYGLYEDKRRTLSDTDVSNTEWSGIEPGSPFYVFLPRRTDLEAEYDAAWRVSTIFKFVGEGFTSHRDNFAVAFAEEEAGRRLADLLAPHIPDEELRRKYALADTSTWSLQAARVKLKADAAARAAIRPCLYRPFDKRFCLLHPALMDRPRLQSQATLSRANLALSTTRNVEIHRGFEHVFCTKDVLDRHAVSIKEINYLFPLYLYPDRNTNGDLFSNGASRHVNLNPSFVADLEKRLGMSFISDGKGDLKATFGPEDVFNYIYAVFHSPTYRTRYAEFLKIDFPRVPLTSNAELFRSLCALGGELVALHLMEKTGRNLPNYPIALRAADPLRNRVEHVRYTAPGQGAELGQVWMNKAQYFEGVPPEIWEFHVGGYQVCHKWLKDRKGRALTQDELEHYRRVVAALGDTIRLMSEIDAAIESHGGWPIR